MSNSKKNNKKWCQWGIAIFLLAFGFFEAGIAQQADEDKTLSPYFLVTSDSGENNTDIMPLKETKVDVAIAGVIADVSVKQVYKNQGKLPLEAVYIFPGSTHAAVYGMVLKIGERTIVADVKEREQARQDYEQAKKQGKTASLLEQNRPNVFQMNVANILPGDNIEVELKYTELLVPENGTYEFVYPTVVGPRYVSKNEQENRKPAEWVANPYLHEGEKPNYTFDINVNINAGMPVQNVACKTHLTEIKFQGENTAAISLNKNNLHEGNRDFIVNFSLKGNNIESGVLLYEGENENFFLAMVQPPERIEPEVIPPREYVFIIDVSGSMSGFPLDVSKKMIKDIFSTLNDKDKFNILMFAGGSQVFAENSLPATPDNVEKALAFIDGQLAGGGTELLPALKRALEMNSSEGYARTFVISTDGYVTVEKEAFDLIRENLGEANFFTFGIGSSVNRFLIEGMARAGKGETFIVTDFKDAAYQSTVFAEYIKAPVLTDINIGYNGFDAYDMEPLHVHDLYANRPVLVYGKYKKASGNISITGTSGNGEYQAYYSLDKLKAEEKNSALRYLWARNKLKWLSDYKKIDRSSDYKKPITELGLTYNLLTEFTSFVAIDSEGRNTSDTLASVVQPLPLPEGVSDMAVGGSVRYASKSMSVSSAVSRFSIADNEANLEMEEVAEDEIFFIVEDMPKFMGKDWSEVRKYLMENITYPDSLNESNVYGKVIIQFTIAKNGDVKDIKVLRSIHPDLDNEVIRVLKSTQGKWTPGKQRGKPVDVQFTLPINIDIQ